MAKFVLYYSSYGHVETMAHAVAEGARAAAADVTVKRVPELVPDDIARRSGFKVDQPAPIATPMELAEYDAVVFGTPTRYGNMASQMKGSDETGRLWMEGSLVGKVGSVFTSTATQHGGQESTILSFHTVLLHLGFVIVGLPYAFKGQFFDEYHRRQPLGQRPLRRAMARACRVPMNSTAPVFRAVTWRRLPASCFG